MSSEGIVFSSSGPTYLTSVDWKCPNHRRCVTASLVQSVYILELDREEKREGPEALAPPWWEFFQYKPIRQLVDNVDSSIYGAIFEFTPPPSAQNSLITDAPRFIVAFRGTITTRGCRSRDIILDLHIVENGLHRTSRCVHALQTVQDLVSEFESTSTSIWLAGHSLGAAIATIAGKRIAKLGILLDTFLFNPPFFKLPTGNIKDDVKNRIRITGSLIRAGLSVVLQGKKDRPDMEASFAILSTWIPSLFVHPCDRISSAYIDYFRHRREMEEIGAGTVEKVATQISIRGMVFNAIGKECDPYHLLPSASLMVNLSPCEELRKAHALHQWWELDLHVQTTRHIYK